MTRKMITGRTLRVVDPSPDIEAIKAESARVGKHISDLMRADVEKVIWRPVHIAGDRRKPVWLPGLQRKWRAWRG